MNVLQIAALAVLAATLAFVLRTLGAKAAPALTVTAGLAFVAYAVARYGEAISAIREMAERAGVSEGVSVILRMIFVGLLCAVAADICRDVGEGGLATRVEACGKAEILLLALPFLLELVTLAFEVCV